MTKTMSALERLRHRFIQDVNFGGHRDSVRFTRDEMNEIIAAFEDEQRESEASIAAAIEQRDTIRDNFSAYMRQRDERDAKIRELLLRPRNTPEDYACALHPLGPCEGFHRTAVGQVIALLDGEKGGAQ